MIEFKSLWHSRKCLLPALAVALLLVFATAVIAMSATGRALFSFATDQSDVLGSDENIRAWAKFDHPSYRVGDIARYRIRVVWRNAVVTPDLDSLTTNISFFPFSQRDSTVNEQSLGLGLREFNAEYVLQAVGVDPAASYGLDTVTVYYTRVDDEHANPNAIRTNPPRVHIGEYYPGDISSIPLRPTKPAIDDARNLRRFLIAACGVGLSLVLLVLLWQRVRRRPDVELSPAERLWRRFDQLRQRASNERDHVMQYERLFTEALELRSGVAPLAFWSGVTSGENDSNEQLDKARRLFGQAYRPSGPSMADLQQIDSMIEGLLAPMVETDRLERETHEPFIQRLQREPVLFATSIFLVLTALSAFVLAALPSTWLPADLKNYNAAVAQQNGGVEIRDVVTLFSDLADISENPRVRAASLYNLGTLLADPRMTRMSREQHENFLRAIFLPDINMNLLLHDLELDSEAELLTLLTELTRQYVQAEHALKAAAQVQPHDVDTGRNLEILGKLRRAIGQSLAKLIEQGDQSDGSQQMLSQTVIDLMLLMEAELPDDYAKLDAGKDDRDYFIMERF